MTNLIEKEYEVELTHTYTKTVTVKACTNDDAIERAELISGDFNLQSSCVVKTTDICQKKQPNNILLTNSPDA